MKENKNTLKLHILQRVFVVKLKKYLSLNFQDL